MPRQTKENFKPNDRSYDITDILQKCNDIKILNTDNINKLEEQLTIINNSKNIILTGGSPYIVNGFFCINKNIIVLDNIVVHQSKKFSKMKYIHNFILKNNIVNSIPKKKFTYNDIKKYLI